MAQRAYALGKKKSAEDLKGGKVFSASRKKRAVGLGGGQGLYGASTKKKTRCRPRGGQGLYNAFRGKKRATRTSGGKGLRCGATPSISRCRARTGSMVFPMFFQGCRDTYFNHENQA